MSMYSELLAASSAKERAGRPVAASKGELLAQLLARRIDLDDASPSDGAQPDVAGHLTRQLDYDIALIRLCRALGIDAEPSGFEHPQPERQRLEQELKNAGVDLAAYDLVGGETAAAPRAP
jgi:hypothetical protein